MRLILLCSDPEQSVTERPRKDLKSWTPVTVPDRVADGQLNLCSSCSAPGSSARHLSRSSAKSALADGTVGGHSALIRRSCLSLSGSLLLFRVQSLRIPNR